MNIVLVTTLVDSPWFDDCKSASSMLINMADSKAFWSSADRDYANTIARAAYEIDRSGHIPVGVLSGVLLNQAGECPCVQLPYFI